jgi:hypothetical protein
MTIDGNKLVFCVSDPLSFWATDYRIKELLPILTPIVELLKQNGFCEGKAGVGGGVHELDTGYESFERTYNSYDEMNKNILSDYEAEKSALVGTWYDILNFESMSVYMERITDSVRIVYCRGNLSFIFSNSASMNEFKDKIAEIVTPFVRTKE